MMTIVIIAISVLAYFTAGIATAVMDMLHEGESAEGDPGYVLVIVMFWPIFLVMYLPIFAARWIRARRAARREKPKVFSEYDEENR